MKLWLSVFVVMVLSSGHSQNSFSEVEAQKIIDIFFEGFHTGDTLLIKSVMAEQLVMLTTFSDKNGNHLVSSTRVKDFFNSVANRPKDQYWDERLLDYKIELDGNLAHVWTPYEFWFNGNFSHCGANSFTLARFNDGWKIIHLIDSRRKLGCN